MHRGSLVEKAWADKLAKHTAYSVACISRSEQARIEDAAVFTAHSGD